MTFAVRERLAAAGAAPVGRSIAAALATAVVLALTGPFGTYAALALPARLVYWLGVIGAIWALMHLLLGALAQRVADRLPAPRASLALAGAALALVPATAIVALANRLALPDGGSSFGSLLWKVGLLLAVVALLFGPRRGATPPAGVAPHQGPPRHPAAAPDPTGRFQERLPWESRGRLLRLEQEDHYLRVHTDRGQPLIHCRMSDAARELADADGLRVHRSHWVARMAVAEVLRRNHRLALRLEDGSEVPVGKTYRGALKTSGWL
ncbi:hypothetical protein CKO28_12220 [Rhodovibrio sodomensis]|uniref:HTH LytTR-type domain-containing protein n=1 Tax=Rhodovibrio sodomensis TaxID=1088 RepID=A0ABS1DFR5_9PROT|nr:LytTR family DNA-binding domain-containing protein [Rhodovibrio sodomensis]MBK1668796.1 hypothetical protein [Rhodovibrio sodomensis]